MIKCISDEDMKNYCDNETALKVIKDIAFKKYDVEHEGATITGVQLFTINTKFKYDLEIGVIVNTRGVPNSINVSIEMFKIKRRELDRLIVLEEIR